jgi:5'-3' exonuclease
MKQKTALQLLQEIKRLLKEVEENQALICGIYVEKSKNKERDLVCGDKPDTMRGRPLFHHQV